jgi:DEAD/DEAH box helicase domain-containing protein
MLPSALARQLKDGLIDYINAIFPITTPAFANALRKMLNEEDAVFHEPYVTIRLPFRLAEGEPTSQFESIRMGWTPYVHQRKAFDRLLGENGRSTLVATGTGSGKTECFLYPILEYCYRHREEKGIKALIIYPMNALAADQAKRIAKLISENSLLKGNITAGMYVGGLEENASLAMTGDRVITDHVTLLSAPPSILLTNYKMLDYLLARPKDSALWRNNGPRTLKYVVIDELHSFDGAQGTDLACLLRRLKARLDAEKGHICCVGTSATMGGGDDTGGLVKYASEIFGEPFEPDSVIVEDRFSAMEFLSDSSPEDFKVPDQNDTESLSEALGSGDREDFLKAAAKAWFGEGFSGIDLMGDEARFELGRRLKGHEFARKLLSYMAGGYVQTKRAVEEMGFLFQSLWKAGDPSLALEALYALISHARSEWPAGTGPFLSLEAQFWFRELRRLLAKVTKGEVSLALADDLKEQADGHYLPILTCRNCGATGWGSVVNERGSLWLGSDVKDFYGHFFSRSDKVKVLYPNGRSENPDTPEGFYPALLCPKCLQLDPGEDPSLTCSSCGAESIRVAAPKKLVQAEGRGTQPFLCPHCQSETGLVILGLRSATAISSIVSQLFASRLNDDKKSLAFSDNVQDAAHRAGFFNARAFRPSLRRAIQRFALDGGDGLSLNDFTTGFANYWRARLSHEEFVSRFIAPNMTWKSAYEDMKKNGALNLNPRGRNLLNSIERRLGYEIMLEYGLLSFTDRTLVNSGSSVLSHPPESIQAAATAIRERAVNELGLPDGPEYSKAYARIALGFLHLMRVGGAFGDEAFNEYAQNGETYLLSNDRFDWLPGLHADVNAPRFVCLPTAAQSAISHIIIPKLFDNGTGKGRYRDWVASCLGPNFKKDPERLTKVAEIAFGELSAAKLIAPMPSAKKVKTWALDKDRVHVTTDVKPLTCQRCQSRLWVGADNAADWEGAPCPRLKCQGLLSVDETRPNGYFKKLYESGDFFRISAREHTGLLTRESREKLESEFRRGGLERRPWYPNLLSCTPTLELGLDIGDLSSVILCSVPPGRSQYAQRTGRAGRRDGNALTITVVNAQPHDMYFYAEPMEIMAAPVEPPKIFLKATAVLERQYFAYCLDSWIKAGVAENAIPKSIGQCLVGPKNSQPGRFPQTFLVFAKSNADGLAQSFLGMFPELNESDDGYKEIELFAKGSGGTSPMHLKVQKTFVSLYERRKLLIERLKILDKLNHSIQAKSLDANSSDELTNLMSEIKALREILKNINSKDVFNFLSDEGLLPNYAFPEKGIGLTGVLYRKNDQKKYQNTDKSETSEDKIGASQNKPQKPQKTVSEFNRPASAAIAELAPANTFYADGHKFTIDQLDLTTAQPIQWRLCPRCSHARIEESGQKISSCPVCGSPMWADSGQLRSMLKVKSVYSNMKYGKSLIGDENDDRQTKYYNRKTLVDIDEDNDILDSFTIKNNKFTFGYEFIRNATIRDINFGEIAGIGDRLTIQGQESICKGFDVCKYCGKVQTDPNKPQHAFFCHARRAGTDEPFVERLFLYRELSTEAMRILVPATTVDPSNVALESFIAAFTLGMKGYFGNVDHLQSTITSLPLDGTNYRKQFLVVYDSVPGGTGYLKQLMRERHSMITILEKALSLLENCPCRLDPAKDGCYHCLYAYKRRQSIGQTSRTKAMEILTQILSGRDNLVGNQPRLSRLEVTDLLESELERRFIEALSSMTTGQRPINVTKEMVKGKEGFRLTVGRDPAQGVVWEIEPQVKLGLPDGVSVRTEADFVFWPARNREKVLPVAVYTDGFVFHKDKVADDTLKRAAVARSGKFRVWSINWSDVESVLSGQGAHGAPILDPNRMPSGREVYRPSVKNNHKATSIWPEQTTTMELLVHYLEIPSPDEVFRVHAEAYGFSLLDPGKRADQLAFNRWNNKIPRPWLPTLGPEAQFQFKETIFGHWLPAEDSHIEIFAGINPTPGPIQNHSPNPLVLAILEDRSDYRREGYETDWKEFWHFYNVMQFSDKFSAVTESGLLDSVYNNLSTVLVAGAEPTTASDWDDVLRLLFDTDAKKFAKECSQLGLPAPDSVGFELEGHNGEVVGEAELAWPKAKVALLLADQLVTKNQFNADGWRVITVNDHPQLTWFSEAR